MIRLAGLRTLQISIGIVVALVVNHVLFPKHPRVLFLTGMARVLEEVRELYGGLSRRTLNDRPHSKSGPAHSGSAKLELRIRELIARENAYLKQMEHEISLMPKPTGLYRVATGHVQRLADLVAGLRRIRENVPHAAIEHVLRHRQQAASCITLALFACEHAFRSRRALPQVLPSPRRALEVVSSEMMDTLRAEARATDVGYAMAENEVLVEMVSALEGLVQVARGLFGTSEWLHGVDDIHMMVGLDRGGTRLSE